MDKPEIKVSKTIKIECVGFVLQEVDEHFNYTISANNKGDCSHLEVIGNIYENPELL